MAVANEDLISAINPKIKRLVEMYKQAQTIRMPLEADWRMVAQLGLPREYGGWVSSSGPNSVGGIGQNATMAREARIAQFDSTLARSIPKFGAIVERLMTPISQTYHILRPTDLSKLKSRRVREYYDSYNELLFALRYHPRARFSSTQGQLYRSFGAYGNACKMVNWRNRPINEGRSPKQGKYSNDGGFLYRAVPFSQMYWMTDHEEQVNLWFRRILWTARQAYEALGDKWCPKKVREHHEKKAGHDMSRTFEFFQVIMPTEEYEEHAFDHRRFPLTSLYIFVEDQALVADPSGYYSQPTITPRMYGEDGIPYGYGCAQQVLSNVGSANAMAKTALKIGQKKGDPPLLAREDGILNGVSVVPSAINYGGIDSQGRKMIQTLDVGDWQMPEKLHASQQYDIKDAFFVTLFEMVKDRPQMTATEIMQYALDNAAMLSPTMGLLQAEDQGPQIEREIDLCEQMGIAPEKPGEILEDPSYDVVYTSPLAKAARGESVKGFVFMTNMAMEYAKQTQDTRPLKMLNFMDAMPEIADLNSVPARWMNDPAQVAALEGQEQQEKQTQQMIDVAPAAASVIRSASSNGNKAPA